jgi:mycothiol synthase
VSVAEVTRLDRLNADQVAAVRKLVERATDADGVAPLSEHVLLHLEHGGDDRDANLLLHVDGAVAGYAHLDTTDPVSGPSAELVVDPDRRGVGLGAQLVTELSDLAAAGSGDDRLRLWAHGQHAGAEKLAARFGFVRTRALWQMRRSLYAPIPVPSYPSDIVVRTFDLGRDEDAWLEVNRRAFVDLPDQGSWQRRDLEQREAEAWFDPAGFFLAERSDRLLAFHWTKVHGAPHTETGPGHEHEHAHPPLGEVYVLGVDPDARGLGLGRSLTLTGLLHLRGRRLPSVMLYVDESNAAAIALYTGLGFTRWDTDVTYQRG